MTPGATVTPIACRMDTLENASRPKPATVVRLANSIEASVRGKMGVRRIRPIKKQRVIGAHRDHQQQTHQMQNDHLLAQ